MSAIQGINAAMVQKYENGELDDKNLIYYGKQLSTKGELVMQSIKWLGIKIIPRYGHASQDYNNYFRNKAIVHAKTVLSIGIYITTDNKKPTAKLHNSPLHLHATQTAITTSLEINNANDKLGVIIQEMTRQSTTKDAKAFENLATLIAIVDQKTEWQAADRAEIGKILLSILHKDQLASVSKDDLAKMSDEDMVLFSKQVDILHALPSNQRSVHAAQSLYNNYSTKNDAAHEMLLHIMQDPLASAELIHIYNKPPISGCDAAFILQYLTCNKCTDCARKLELLRDLGSQIDNTTKDLLLHIDANYLDKSCIQKFVKELKAKYPTLSPAAVAQAFNAMLGGKYAEKKSKKQSEVTKSAIDDLTSTVRYADTRKQFEKQIIRFAMHETAKQQVLPQKYAGSAAEELVNKIIYELVDLNPNDATNMAVIQQLIKSIILQNPQKQDINEILTIVKGKQKKQLDPQKINLSDIQNTVTEALAKKVKKQGAMGTLDVLANNPLFMIKQVLPNVNARFFGGTNQAATEKIGEIIVDLETIEAKIIDKPLFQAAMLLAKAGLNAFFKKADKAIGEVKNQAQVIPQLLEKERKQLSQLDSKTIHRMFHEGGLDETILQNHQLQIIGLILPTIVNQLMIAREECGDVSKKMDQKQTITNPIAIFIAQIAPKITKNVAQWIIPRLIDKASSFLCGSIGSRVVCKFAKWQAVKQLEPHLDNLIKEGKMTAEDKKLALRMLNTTLDLAFLCLPVLAQNNPTSAKEILGKYLNVLKELHTSFVEPCSVEAPIAPKELKVNASVTQKTQYAEQLHKYEEECSAHEGLVALAEKNYRNKLNGVVLNLFAIVAKDMTAYKEYSESQINVTSPVSKQT